MLSKIELLYVIVIQYYTMQPQHNNANVSDTNAH